ncbi:MAG TPA: FAD-dependent monooxygenase [Roseiflexaceae bacterium]|nr:FAD-dependent monooxygenase [Roseiflexaceae bacterium]
MKQSPFTVLIIGGGLGGLCLAQGLKKAGIRADVYERDRAPDDRLQGYRIHIEPQGNRALAACLPTDLFRQYLATSGSGGSGFRISTEQLKQLVFFHAPAPAADRDPAKLDRSVSRITLRQILLAGLEDIVHFDKTFTHYQETADGRVTACFADGTSATGDLLVAADGGKSRVRQQLLPESRLVPTSVEAIMGKLALTEATRELLVPGQLDTATSILGPNRRAMFIALHELGERAEIGARAIGGNDPLLQAYPGLLFDNRSDYIFWALLAREETYPVAGGVQRLDGVALQQVALQMIEGWHPRLRQLVRDSDPSTIICKPLQAAQPVKQWATRRVTLLGDAIHSMPPTRGIGGNTALRDAQLLCEQLSAASSGAQPLLTAIHRYETEMLKYGFAAVRSSMQALQLHVAESRLVSNTLLRSMNGLLALQRLSQRKAA